MELRNRRHSSVQPEVGIYQTEETRLRLARLRSFSSNTVNQDIGGRVKQYLNILYNNNERYNPPHPRIRTFIPNPTGEGEEVDEVSTSLAKRLSSCRPIYTEKDGPFKFGGVQYGLYHKRNNLQYMRYDEEHNVSRLPNSW